MATGQDLRIAIYSQDGFGLGHMQRTCSIAWEIYRLRSEASILTFSDSLLGQFFPISPHHDYIKLPSIAKDSPGNWNATHLRMSFPEILKLRQELIRNVLLSYAPDVFLVDHMPHGAMGELLPALEAMEKAGLQTRNVLGLRDILDSPEVTINRWQVEGAYEVIERYYARILVYGMQDVYDVAEKYQLPEDAAQKLYYCGYVSNLDHERNAYNIRARYLAGKSADTRLIVVMAGGGADAHTMMSTLIEALPKVLEDQPCILAVITGPFMPVELIADLERRAGKLPIQMLEAVNDSLSYLSAADLVIAMAGYNTSVEILRMKTPAILIPRSGPSAEQRTRARLFAEKHWVDMIDPDDLTPETLAECITSHLRHPNGSKPSALPNLGGAAVAAKHTLAVLASKKERVQTSLV
ncbi:MAG TPA: glycosyltransferase [Anaerolineales bacterium]|nr:glycosyltransferase [Anaerolineales bacterium]